MNLKFIPCLILVLIISSCATVHKNGYHQSRKYRGKTVSFKSKPKTQKRNLEKTVSFDRLENKPISVVLDENIFSIEPSSFFTNHPSQIASFSKNPINTNADFEVKTPTIDADFHEASTLRNKPNIDFTDTKLESFSKHLNSFEFSKYEHKEGNYLFAILAAILFIATILFVLLSILIGLDILFLPILAFIGFFILAVISFIVNKDVSRNQRYVIVKAVNICLLIVIPFFVLLAFLAFTWGL